MMTRILSFLFASLFISSVFSQGVTVGSNNPPDPSAALDIQDTTRGFLLPRLTTVQRNNISSPAMGLMIINTTTHCIETYFNNTWVPISCACPGVLPALSPISGALTVCPGAANVPFQVPVVPGAMSYQWTVDNQDVLNQQGNNNTTVDFSGNTGMRTISVVAIDSCGNIATAPESITVNVQLPDASFTLNPSPTTVNTATAFNANTSNATYAWTFQGGTPASSVSQSGNVSWNSQGTYSVSLTVTQNGCSATDSANITVNPVCAAANGNALAGPHTQYGFCWYLSQPGVSCDQLCNNLPGGANLANSATGSWPDNCSSADIDDITMWFYNNGNPGQWTGYGVGTAYHTLGYGYTNSSFYGKCASGSNISAGTFPGETNNNGTRSNVCPCYVSP